MTPSEMDGLLGLLGRLGLTVQQLETQQQQLAAERDTALTRLEAYEQETTDPSKEGADDG